MTAIEFEHIQSAHCENGVISNLIRHKATGLSEPMIFGIGSGLFFSYLPFLKLNGTPVVSFRTLPGNIFMRATKRLGISMYRKTYRSQESAMNDLDRTIDKGIPVGLQTSVYYLPYLPAAYRFHFNAHNIVVYGKEHNLYLISDPVMNTVTTIEKNDLVRARFAKGPLAPNGKMYYPDKFPNSFDLKKPIVKGIKYTASDMANVPFPYFGVKGINYLSKQIRKAPEKYGNRHAKVFLGNLIRMQEEIGTGGGGFRFIFAAFLQEAANELNQDWLKEMSVEITATGDRWREFAFLAGRVCKDRVKDGTTYDQLADIVADCSVKEKKIFDRLKKISL